MTDTFARYLANTMLAQGYKPGAPAMAAALAEQADYVLTRSDGMTLEIAVLIDREARPGAQFTTSAETVRAVLTQCLALCGKVGRTQMPASLDVYEVGAAPPDPAQQARLAELHTGKRAIPVAGWVVDAAAGTVWCSRPRRMWLHGRALRRLLRRPRLDDAAMAAAAVPVQDVAPRATWALLAVLAAVFLAEVDLAGASTSRLMAVPSGLLFLMGGTTGELVLSGQQTWRMVTAAFLHGGLLHIVFNGVALWLVGTLLERVVGWAWFLAMFFIGAAAGSAFSGWLNPQVLSVGASGAILGLAGAALIVSSRMHYADRQQTRIALLQVMVPSLLPVLFLGRGTHVDYGAHIGGAIAGLACGAWIVATWPRGSARPAGQGGAMLAAAVGAGIALRGGDLALHQLRAMGVI